MRKPAIESLSRHAAIIMDANRRWAGQKAKNGILWHKEGAESVDGIVTRCKELGKFYAVGDSEGATQVFQARVGPQHGI